MKERKGRKEKEKNNILKLNKNNTAERKVRKKKKDFRVEIRLDR